MMQLQVLGCPRRCCLLPAMHLCSFSPSSQGDLGAPGPKGDKVSPWGGGQWGGRQQPWPPLLPPPLSLGVQGDTVVVEGPPGARGSKGEPVRTLPIMPLPILPVPLGRAGGAFSCFFLLRDPPLHIIPSPSATLPTPMFLPPWESVLPTLMCQSFSSFPDPPCVSSFAGRAWPEGHRRGQGGQGGARHARREGTGLGGTCAGLGAAGLGVMEGCWQGSGQRKQGMTASLCPLCWC